MMAHSFVGRLASGQRVRVNHDGTAPVVVAAGRVLATGWPADLDAGEWVFASGLVVTPDHPHADDPLAWWATDGARHEGGTLSGDRSRVRLLDEDTTVVAEVLLPSVTRARSGVRLVSGFDRSGAPVAFEVAPINRGCGCGA